MFAQRKFRSACACAVWSESSLGAFWIAIDAKVLHADNGDSNQPARMRRLIWVFFGRICQKVRSLPLRFLLLNASTSQRLPFPSYYIDHKSAKLRKLLYVVVWRSCIYPYPTAVRVYLRFRGRTEAVGLLKSIQGSPEMSLIFKF